MGVKLTVTNTEAVNNENSVDIVTNNENSEDILNNENIIELTDHTITKYNKCMEALNNNTNEYFSREIKGLEITGRIDVYDKSGEMLEVVKLSEWAKKTAHEKESYRDLVIEISDSNNNIYDVLHFKEAFIVNYKEIFRGKKDIGEFYTLIRCTDNLEEIIKE